MITNERPNFQIIGTKIYDPDGKEFIIKGTNMFAWEEIGNLNSYVNNWGFNAIRVPNYLLGSYDRPHPEESNYNINQKIADAYTSQGSVVIFDAHDLLGFYYENEDWEILKDYWREMAQRFKDNPHVWFNLHNEPGNATAKPEKWVEYHRELINIIRNEGANNIIVVDGEAWGQDYPNKTISNKAEEVMVGNKNIVFSLHIYDRWLDNNLDKYLAELQKKNIPLLIGEYGVENETHNTLSATQNMMDSVREREIGRIVWVAKGDDNNDLTLGVGGDAEHFDGSNPEILTDLGELVWQDLQREEDLEQLDIQTFDFNTLPDKGVFQVDSEGIVKVDFLFDGVGTQGEVGIYSLEGMYEYGIGSQEYIIEAASRAVSNSKLGHIVIKDLDEAALFSSPLDWEYNHNLGEYLGIKEFEMNPGDSFGLIFLRNNKISETVNNPDDIWRSGKLPYFSISKANPGGSEAQMVAFNEYNTFALEDVRVDWEEGDRDYNDIVFQIQGATAKAESIDEWINPERDWRNYSFAQELSQYTSRVGVTIECFLSNTHILTDKGEVTVEKLCIGDKVITKEGQLETIKWVGKQTIKPHEVANPLRGYPILIKAGALGENLPHRDLYVSPDHGILFEGLLINAGALVNDRSILKTSPTQTFVYYHLELEKHSILIAEGAKAESYLPQRENRKEYDNGDEYELLYPNGSNLMLCPMDYPRVSSKSKVPRYIRTQIDRIAEDFCYSKSFVS